MYSLELGVLRPFQTPEAYELFREDTCTLLGASELRVLSSPPADVDQYTSMAVDETTTVYLKMAVRGE